MKIAISNIAWEPEENDRVAEMMCSRNIGGVELAPTKNWPDLTQAADSDVAACRSWWASRGIRVVALQSLLFGRADLNVFGTHDTRRRMLAYLKRAMRIAALLGAKVLVFGSPKNRRVGDMEPRQAMDIAVEFFSCLAELAQVAGVCVALEPNPEAYGCDFVRTSQEALDLVKRVGNPAFRVHLDTAILSMNGEPFEQALNRCFEYLAHVHISEPMLGVVGEGYVDHAGMARALRTVGYSNWISIEMRSGWRGDNAVSVQRALDYAGSTYTLAETVFYAG